MIDAVSEIAILVDNDRNRKTVAKQVGTRLLELSREDAVALGWPTLMPGVEQSIKFDWNTGLILYFILALVVGFGIANTFLMAFLERTHELGVLIALGMRPILISSMLYLESTLLTLSGVVLGLLVGVPFVYYFQQTGLNFGESSGDVMAEYGMSPVIYPEISWFVMEWAVGIVLSVSLFLAIYPAFKASRLNPVEALQHT